MSDITPHQEEAFNFYQKLIELRKQASELYLELGFTLKKIKDGKLYKYLGDGGFDSWQLFLANPEINIRYQTAEVYIKVYEYFIEELKMPRAEVIAMPLGKLNMMKSTLEKMPDDKERLEFIEKAKLLSYSDFKKELREKGYKTKEKIRVYRHKDCGKLIIEYNPQEICLCSGSQNIKPLKYD